MQKLDRWERMAWIFVGLGIAARLARYLLAFPLWGDECMLAQNFLSRDFAGLLRPLENCQVAPPLWLMLELAAVKLFGFSEWSLRLLPLVAGIAALIVFKHVVGRLLRGPAAVLAVGFLSVAFFPMRHSVEAKPYATDLFVAVGLLALTIEWWHDRTRTRWLWILAAVLPAALGLSFPAVLVAAGISSLLICQVLRGGNRAALVPIAAYHVVLAVSAVGVVAISAASQLDEWGPMMRTCWVAAFPPPIWRPLALLKWLAETYTGLMFAYPLGGKAGGSLITAVCFGFGVAALARRGDRLLALPLVVPFGLGLVCAATRLYPYGDNERLVQYLGPAVCLLAGLGAAQLLARLARPARKQAIASMMVMLAAIAGGEMLRDLSHPYKHRCDWDHQSFARWFWTQAEDSSDMVAMPLPLNRAIYNRTDYTAYACYQAIYADRLKAPGDVCDAAKKPLDCVVFRGDESRGDQPALDRWLKQFEPRYRLAGCTRHRVKTDVGPQHDFYGWYDVYRFVPRADLAQRTSDER